jgi:hypothetical protein
MFFSQKGFSSFATIAIVVVIAAAIFASAATWYFAAHKNPAPPAGPVACTTEAKLCPDGSYVGRTGPSCEFAACPIVASSTPSQTSTSTATSTTGGRGAGAFCGGIATGAFPCDSGYSCKLDGAYPDAGGHCVVDTSSWKTYINQQYGFSFEYPDELYLVKPSSSASCIDDIACLQSSPEDMELGGGIPNSEGPNGFVTTGYAFGLYVDTYSGAFDINNYLATQYANSELDQLSSTTINGNIAYQFTFKEEEDGNDPTMIIPYKGDLYEAHYIARVDDATFASSTMLFDQVFSTFRFIQPTSSVIY